VPISNSKSQVSLSNPSRAISSIQILRGFAALFIVIGHSQGAARELAGLSGQTFSTWQLLPWGVGVDLFFVISGFIIFYSSKKYQGAPHPSRTFFAHRIARLVPLYWLCTALFLAIFVFKRSLGFAQADEFPSIQAIISSLVFFPFDAHPISSGLAFPAYNLGWTLNYEMYFYALFALCLGRSQTQSAVRILVGLCCIVIFGVVFKPDVLPFSFWSQPIILEFGAGIVIAMAFQRGVSFPRPLRLGLISLGFLLIVFLPFGSPVDIGGTNLNDFGRVYIWGLPAALIIAGAALGPDVKKKSWLSIPIEIGNASYSLYLVHPFVIFLMSLLFRRFGILKILPLPYFVGMVVILASIVAVMSYRFFERPSARAVANWLIPSKRMPVPSTTGANIL
jgi:exopolysaccharide production protein ExoZ